VKFRLPAGTASVIAAAKSRKSRSARARGRGFEKSTAEDIREALGAHPEDVKRTPAAIGGKDIVLHHALRARFPFHVECKDCKKLDVPAWITQAETGAEKDGLGLEPAVVFKLPRNSRKYVIVSFDYFLGFIKGEKS
jgi:hypothetical protein